MNPVTVDEIIEELIGLARHAGYHTSELAERIRTHGIAPPDGYVLVPIEPTAEIINAVLSVITDCHSAAESYGDILEAAAPKQENSNE